MSWKNGPVFWIMISNKIKTETMNFLTDFLASFGYETLKGLHCSALFFFSS